VADQRFDLRKELDGTWTVFEVSTGQPAATKSGVASGLNIWQADDLAVLLNVLEIKRRGIPAQPYGYSHGHSAFPHQKRD
jgi:hypothetical protein